MAYKILTLSRDARKRRARNHPWIFSNEISSSPIVEPGELVILKYANSSEAWTAYYNPHSLIAARVLDEGEKKIDLEWLTQRIRAAVAYRDRLRLPRNARRIIHGEADGLPGLIVDQYGGYLVVQSLTAGMDCLLPLAVEALVELFIPEGIFARCDNEIRSLENRDLWSKTLYGEVPDSTEVQCYGIRFQVDLKSGQKTGLFLDQMENNLYVSQFSRGAAVLDVCCYTGSFSFFQAMTGASEVFGVDVAAESVARAAQNAALNGFDRVAFQSGDAFEFLRSQAADKQRYEVVNLDPPAFAKRRKDVESALRGYKELNLRCFKLLKPGGILSTATCSHHITRELFLEMLILAARDAGRRPRIMAVLGAAPDHPPLLYAPETSYLTNVVLQVD